ncbi:MAG: nucleotidyltransferase domain-containing protein [Methanoregula sp.]|nr:nucleotidyltransferase domain-containing protein [Methanoregula sp.]
MTHSKISRKTKRSIPDTIADAINQIQKIPGFERVQFIILYGSAQEERMTADSDIDLCMYYDGDREDAGRFRHKVLSLLPGTLFDIQIFEQLPLYVRIEALKGIPVYTRDTRFLYDKATETIRDFDDFKHRLYDYTGQVPMQ